MILVGYAGKLFQVGHALVLVVFATAIWACGDPIVVLNDIPGVIHNWWVAVAVKYQSLGRVWYQKIRRGLKVYVHCSCSGEYLHFEKIFKVCVTSKGPCQEKKPQGTKIGAASTTKFTKQIWELVRCTMPFNYRIWADMLRCVFWDLHLGTKLQCNKRHKSDVVLIWNQR